LRRRIAQPMDHPMSQHRKPDGPLRVTRVRPGLSPDPADAPYAVERLTALTHDLCGLLDGALRCQLLARRSLAAIAPAAELAAARRHLDTVHGALERMAELVHAAMSGAGAVSPAAQHWLRRAVTLQEAISHAADVLFPEAQQHSIRIEWRVGQSAVPMPAGPLYTVLINGIRNAMESIQRCQNDRPGGRGGLVEILADAGPVNAAGVVLLHITISDDGRGLPSAEDGRRAFEVGYSTKPGSAGVGLALAHEVVREVGGTIELLPREDRAGMMRPGAVLKIAYPVIAPGT
jgi:signal transduction histidine kinase